MQGTMIQYAVQTGTPVPERSESLRGIERRTLATMKKGDSFLMSKRYLTNCYRAATSLGIKVTTRKIDGEGIRVWRIE